jgi:hypothetical protein
MRPTHILRLALLFAGMALLPEAGIDLEPWRSSWKTRAWPSSARPSVR